MAMVENKRKEEDQIPFGVDGISDVDSISDVDQGLYILSNLLPI
jgi:hypothetical protein